MHADLRAQAAFRLTGLRADAGLWPRVRPALSARVRDLAALRYAFPIVLLARGGAEPAVPLSTLIDRLAESEAPRATLLRVEKAIRAALASGVEGTLAEVWDVAIARIGGGAAKGLLESAAAARRKLPEGTLVDCDARFPERFVAHAWKLAEERKTLALREEIDALLFRLRQVLEAEQARSAEGRSAARLAETFGQGGAAFDFDAMARLLARTPSAASDGERRRRIEMLVAKLERARSFTGADHEAFMFDRCASALRAFRSRLDDVRGFVATMAMARLEVKGAYDEVLHGPLVRQLRESALPAEELQRLPSYLVCVRWSALDAAERADVEALLCADVPARIVVQFDDLLDECGPHGELRGIGSHAHALAGSALGLGDVFVVQAAASALPSMGEALQAGIAYPGVTLFTVFSGAGGAASLPPYLNAAAALESRVFPSFAYDPSVGEAGELSLAGNPQADAEWPIHELDYEDAALQRTRRRMPFTPADFVAADARFTRHFMPIDRAAADDSPGTSTVFTVDDDDRLHELLVDEPVAIHARRCANRWRHLKRLAADGVVVPAALAPVASPPPVVEAPPPAAPVEAAPAPAATQGSDDPYIETPRCTTCNECTQLNNRMFAYDANKQAYIADITAGTYRQLVEAAESCQVSIIHPGKPRNPDEPGLEELLERALPFL